MKNILIIAFGFFICILMGCNENSSDIAGAASATNTGIAGSYARFMIVDNSLYIVDDEKIKTYSLTTPATPSLVNEQVIGERIESIFHLDGKLFIGSGSGLYIYTIDPNNNGIPNHTSTFSYDIFPVYPCDPVVADENYAYVTLNTQLRSSACGGTVELQVNQLNIFDISNISSPQLIAEYQMEHPKGVGIDGNTLFLCDDYAGLKVLDVSDPLNVQTIAHFDNITTYDVIPLDGLLLVVGPDNIYQFDYSDLNNIQLISSIPIEA